MRGASGGAAQEGRDAPQCSGRELCRWRQGPATQLWAAGAAVGATGTSVGAAERRRGAAGRAQQDPALLGGPKQLGAPCRSCKRSKTLKMRWATLNICLNTAMRGLYECCCSLACIQGPEAGAPRPPLRPPVSTRRALTEGRLINCRWPKPRRIKPLALTWVC